MKVSVIVPVYKTEKYLCQCIDSILTQTYTDMEIILVDDGSPDNSGAICDNYATTDARVRVFHIENGGVSNARNYALDRITGEYVMFIDSDDLVKPDYIQIMLAMAIKEKAEIVTCRLMQGKKYSISDFEKYQYKSPLKYRKITLTDYRPNDDSARNESQGALFAVPLTNGIRFSQDLWIGEDLLFFHQLLKRAGEFISVEEPLYYYRYRDDSAYHSSYNYRKAIEISAREQVADLFDDMPDTSRREFRAVVGIFCRKHYMMALNADLQDRDLKRMLRRKMWEYCDGIMKSEKIRLKYKISYLLFACSPELFVKVRRLLPAAGEQNMVNTVLLVTLEGTHNFGNRLQNYALYHAIESNGFTVDNLMVLRSVPSNIKPKNIIKALLTRLGVNKYRINLSFWKRTEKFTAFNTKKLPHFIRMPVDEVRQTDWSGYAFAVTGSDQVWHNWKNKSIPEELSFYYLEFIDEAKRVSYAPSFGFTAFPPEDIEQHRRGLMGMHALSCREWEGCELIRELTGREAQQVLDPTLLLTADEWSEIEKKPRFKLPDRYLLHFFLGNVTAEYQTEINRIAVARSLQIININDKTDPWHYAIGPDEFVWLVHHADTVCTDSFHATVFSICFSKNLRVFHRRQKGCEDMFGRLQDLLEPLGLMGLVYGESNGLSTSLSKDAKAYLARERDASLAYLKKSLNAE